MTKAKQLPKKKNMSSVFQQKKSKMKSEKKLNPFEIRFAKEKFKVVNRPMKTEAGKPGISRARAIVKRKGTLLQDYKMRDKTNVFVDRRIGELDQKMTSEDRMIARYTAERMKQHGKKSIFNLGEEETLTHFGRSLADVERLQDDPRSDDEDDATNDKRLGAEYVSEAHFGGFLTRSDVEYAEGKSNSRKEWIDSIIAESKKKRADRQKDHETTVNMTVDLDTKWKEIMMNLKSKGIVKPKKGETEKEADNEDSYNVLMKELAFEGRKGKAQDRLKTAEEIIAEEKSRLEKLELDRIRRMKGDFDPEIDGDEEEQEGENNSIESSNKNKESVEEGDDVCEDEEEGEEEEEEDDDESSGSEEDEYSDLEESEDDSDKPSKKSKKIKEIDPEVKRQLMEEAQSEIPFTFKVPETYEELLSFFNKRSPENKSLIIERIIKCNHPQFGDENKEKLALLFQFILQHIHDCLSEDDYEDLVVGLNAAQRLTPFLFDLAKFFPQPAAKSILNVLQEKYEDYRSRAKTFPALETIIFFKLTILLFPSSDYRHPVVTPALQFMSEILCNARPFTRPSLAAGLLISSIMVEAISLSKRFSPELLNFLVGIIFMSVPKDSQTVIPYVPPFKVVGKESTFLFDALKKRHSPTPIKLSEVNMDSGEEIDSNFASSCIHATLNLMIKLCHSWREMPSAWQIFQLLSEKFLPLLPIKKLDASTRLLVTALKDLLGLMKSESKEKKGSSILPKKPVSMLKLYDPEIDDDFDPFQKKHPGTLDLREKGRLMHKMKREKKSAKKELRKDSVFLAKQKAREMREKDIDRQRRTKEILGGLGVQEGEYKMFQAKKKKKH